MTAQIMTVFDPPLLTDAPETFDAKAQDMGTKLNPWAGEANTLATDVNTNALAAAQAKTDAQTAASTATTQAGLAASAAIAAATTWASGASYAENKLVWVDATGSALYRCIQAHSGRSTPPQNDPSYWASVVGVDVTQSPTDTTPGRILKTRDAGILGGLQAPSAANGGDMEVFARGAGMTSFGHATGDRPANTPINDAGAALRLSPGASYGDALLWSHRDAQRLFYTITPLDSGSGTWGTMLPWVEIVHTGNINTTVGLRKPTNISPANGATGLIWAAPLVTFTEYRSVFGAPQAALQVQVSTASDFATVAHDSGAVASTATSYRVPTGVVAASTTYYWRVRYESVDGDWSLWSDATSFETAANIGHYLDVLPVPTPSNFGDPLEGGFYAGQVWQQIAQSSTSVELDTGSKTFTVPNMTGAPIVYPGQEVEVRSRANPSNRFLGTVTGASGTSLIINVTSINGSGTFSDWSVMAAHRVIVAPKASGESAATVLKNADSALPTACRTLVDGLRATQAMKDADTAVVYPAAHWARGLSIGGRTDWYIPARDELELCWRNLKPVTDNNYASAADRPGSGSYDYQVDGAWRDISNEHGRNLNSTPAGAAYTASVPGQTSAAAFKSGGAEAFVFGSTDSYWSSTDYIDASAWGQRWGTDGPGAQRVYGKQTGLRVRAVRRSIV